MLFMGFFHKTLKDAEKLAKKGDNNADERIEFAPSLLRTNAQS